MTELTNEAIAERLGWTPNEQPDGGVVWCASQYRSYRDYELPNWLHDIAACERDIWPVLVEDHIVQIRVPDGMHVGSVQLTRFDSDDGVPWRRFVGPIAWASGAALMAVPAPRAGDFESARPDGD